MADELQIKHTHKSSRAPLGRTIEALLASRMNRFVSDAVVRPYLLSVWCASFRVTAVAVIDAAQPNGRIIGAHLQTARITHCSNSGGKTSIDEIV